MKISCTVPFVWRGHTGGVELFSKFGSVIELDIDHGDVGTASLLENFIDETERRTWFLFEAARVADGSGH